MRRRDVALGFLLLALPGGAGAVDKDDLTITVDDQSDREVFLNIRDCTEELDDELDLRGSVVNATGEYTLFIQWSVDNATCGFIDDESCGVRQGDCGCLEAVEGRTSIDATVRLVDLLGSDACASGGERQVKFSVGFHPNNATDGGTSDDVLSEDPVIVEIDLDAPEAPTEAPSVSAADGALEVKVAEVKDPDVADYLVCVRPVSAVAPADAGAATDASTTSDETGCSERGKNEATNGVRIEGLENGIAYNVTYATIDDAGNRSAFSNSTRATPQQVLDFAENYSAWRGGEEGGCSAAGAGAALPVLVLGLGGLIGLARVRRRSR